MPATTTHKQAQSGTALHFRPPLVIEILGVVLPTALFIGSAAGLYWLAVEEWFSLFHAPRIVLASLLLTILLWGVILGRWLWK